MVDRKGVEKAARGLQAAWAKAPSPRQLAAKAEFPLRAPTVPLTVEPPYRSRGVGRALLDRALSDAKAKGHTLVVLVGAEAYYSRVGFKMIPVGRADMPGPVDRRRLLVRELTEGAFENVAGMIRPDWRFARDASDAAP